MLPLLSLLPALTGVGPILKKVFTNKYVLIGIVVAVLAFGTWWAVDTHYELVEEYNTLSKNHAELIKKEEMVRADYTKQLSIIKDNTDKTNALELEYNRVKDILGGLDFTKFKDAPVEVIKQADIDINQIINNSYGCIEAATGKVGTPCVK